MEWIALTNSKWLDLKNININYDHKNIINNINLSLETGQNTVLIGANGSGKSTLIKTITRLKHPIYEKNSHLKLFNSTKINIWELRSKIGFVCTELDLRMKANMTITDIIMSGLQGTFGLLNKEIITSEQTKRLDKVMRMLNIDVSNKYYCELSDGQKRKVLLARSLINQPLILVLDEPTTMLDIKSSYSFLNDLRQLSKEKVTIFYTTNNIENIIPEISRIIFLKNGIIIADGEPSEVMTSENISSLYDYNLNIVSKDGFWRAFPND